MSAVVVSSQVAIAIAELARVRADIKAAEARESELRKAIMESMGDADSAVHEGLVVAKVSDISRSGVDAKALEMKFPEVFAQVVKVSSYKRLNIA
jgi:predicted phage-related endonuclease